jgi:hypothetical protein
MRDLATVLFYWELPPRKFLSDDKVMWRTLRARVMPEETGKEEKYKYIILLIFIKLEWAAGFR